VEERVALITGASAGIGKALAYKFHEEGYRVVLVARRISVLQEIERELNSKREKSALGFALDCSKASALEELDQFLNQEKLEVDAAILNAGFGSCGRFHTLNLERELEMVDLNVRSVVAFSHFFANKMCSRNRGAILIVASAGGFQPGPGMATYFATKAFDLHFAEALHQELKPFGVYAGALCPGPTSTEFFEVAGAATLRSTPMPSMSPARVANIAFDGMMEGRAVIVPGFLNSLASWAYRFLPRNLISKVLSIVLLDRAPKK